MNNKWEKAFERLQRVRADYEEANVEAWEAAQGKVERIVGDKAIDWHLAEKARLPDEMARRRADAKDCLYDPIWSDDLALRNSIPLWLSRYPTQPEGRDRDEDVDWKTEHFHYQEEFSLFKTMVMRAFYKHEFMWIGTPEYPRWNDEAPALSNLWKNATVGSKVIFIVWVLLGLYILNSAFEDARGFEYLVIIAWTIATLFFAWIALFAKER